MIQRYFIARLFALSIVSVFLEIPIAKKNKIFAAAYIRYKVKRGDRLEKVARKYHVSVNKILRWNKLRNKNKIFRGQRLKIYKRARSARKIRTGKKKYSYDSDRNIRPSSRSLINFKRPVRRWRILKRFDSFGDETRYGIFCRIRNSAMVYTSYRGRVSKIGFMQGYGRYIIVDHGKGWLSLYSNLKNIMIKKGQKVYRNKALATAKNRKLFFVIAYKGKPLNPLSLLENTFL